LSCVYRFKLYSLHSMEKWNCPLLSVICHIQVPFKAGLTCWALLHFILKVDSQSHKLILLHVDSLREHRVLLSIYSSFIVLTS
jgi:hypothetical protein